jgi:hypothetical protein
MYIPPNPYKDFGNTIPTLPFSSNEQDQTQCTNIAEPKRIDRIDIDKVEPTKSAHEFYFPTSKKIPVYKHDRHVRGKCDEYHKERGETPCKYFTTREESEKLEEIRSKLRKQELKRKKNPWDIGLQKKIHDAQEDLFNWQKRYIDIGPIIGAT